MESQIGNSAPESTRIWSQLSSESNDEDIQTSSYANDEIKYDENLISSIKIYWKIFSNLFRRSIRILRYGESVDYCTRDSEITDEADSSDDRRVRTGSHSRVTSWVSSNTESRFFSS